METKFKRIGFIRHYLTCTAEILEELYQKRIIAIHYDNIPSLDSNEYKESSGAKTSFTRLEEFCQDGALIAADYQLIHPGKLIIGLIKKKSSIISIKMKYNSGSTILSEQTSHSERLEKKSGYFWYKTIQLIDTKIVNFWDYPVLKAILPPFQSVCNWNNAKKILPSLYLFDKLNWDVFSLSDSQLEILCYEYLLSESLLEALLLPIGRSLPEVDIVGFKLQHETIFAQVTFETSPKKIKSKIDKLTWCKNSDLGQKIQLYFFLRQNLQTKYETQPGIHFIGIEAIFKKFSQKDRYPIQYEMLRRWLNPKNL